MNDEYMYIVLIELSVAFVYHGTALYFTFLSKSEKLHLFLVLFSHNTNHYLIL